MSSLRTADGLRMLRTAESAFPENYSLTFEDPEDLADG
jgi:hypothetical protein